MACPGHAASISASFETSAPGRSTSGRNNASARRPSAKGSVPRNSRLSRASSRNGPNAYIVTLPILATSDGFRKFFRSASGLPAGDSAAWHRTQCAPDRLPPGRAQGVRASRRVSHMSLRINAEVPNFTANTTQGTIDFHQWIGDGWAILFSHPKDFTPVCTTEMGYMAGLKPEFDKRNTKIIGLSVDPVENH